MSESPGFYLCKLETFSEIVNYFEWLSMVAGIAALKDFDDENQHHIGFGINCFILGMIGTVIQKMLFNKNMEIVKKYRVTQEEV